MMKYGLMILVSCLGMSGYALAEDVTHNPELDVFAEKIVDIYVNGGEEEYRKLLHPDCPEPIAEKLKHDFSTKWIKGEGEYRIVPFNDRYDTDVLEFKVEPYPQALEFQYWTIDAEGEKIELVTGFPLSLHETGLKIIDYPCFEPKGM